jgi:acyl-coenzyme A thioesterase PaaI-like protein
MSSSASKQPNSRHCFVCGVDNPVGLKLRFYETEQGGVAASFTAPAHFQGYPGVLHGGIIAALLDEVVGRAAMVGDHSHFRLTAKLEIRYRKPVPIGEPLTLKGTVDRRRGHTVTAHAALYLPDGSLGAEAQGLLADLPDLIDSPDQLEALGWRIYPDG